MNRMDKEKIEKLMDCIMEALPDEPETQALKYYHSINAKLDTIFRSVSDNLGARENTKEILEFFMQLEALINQFIKHREEK